MSDPFTVFDGKVRGVVWGRERGDFGIEAPGSLSLHEKAAQEIGIPRGRLIFPMIEHGSTIGVFGKTDVVSIDHLRWRTEVPCDGFILSSNGKIGIAYMPADCSVLVLFGERRGESFLALVHCGWRGILSGIIGKAVHMFCDLGIVRANIRALTTPCIGPCCFAVGAPVMEMFLKRFPGVHLRSRTKDTGEPSIHLRKLIAQEVEESNIACFTIMSGCTKCDAKKYWSHRRGDKERNLVAVALV